MAAEFYTGKVCAKHPELGGKRYIISRKCLKCSVCQTKAWRKANPAATSEHTKTWQRQNPEKKAAIYKAWCKANPERVNVLSLRAQRKANYGITEAQYQALIISQNNCCLICKLPAGDKTLHIDHCHATGKIRGLLCNHCNTGLGRFKDNIELLKAAIKYLKASK